MINFIIIDALEGNLKSYKPIIDKLMFSNNINYKIVNFTNFNNEMQEILLDNSFHNIFIINNCLKTQTLNIDIAHKIRENDLSSDIIFIINKLEMIKNILDQVRKVFCFIVKDKNFENKLTTELKIIINSIVENNNFIIIDKGGNIQISLNDILYIYRETTERKLYIVTKTGKYPLNMTLNKVLNKYDKYFKQVHRACIVNTKEVSLYNWRKNYFILKNGEKVCMLSKKYKESLENSQ